MDDYDYVVGCLIITSLILLALGIGNVAFQGRPGSRQQVLDDRQF